MSIDFQEHIATKVQVPPNDIAKGNPVLTYLLTVFTPHLTRDPQLSAQARGAIIALEGDLKLRQSFGLDKYGQLLYSLNGRDPLVDLYQELLDGIMYTGQAILEQRLGEALQPSLTAMLNCLVALAADTKAAVEPEAVEPVELFSLKRIK